MSRFMIGFQVISVLLFFTGVQVEANPLHQCMEKMKFHEDIQAFLKLEDKQQLNLFCTNATDFFNCLNDVLKENTGFTIKEMAIYVKGTETGNYLNSLIEMNEYVEKVCRKRPKKYTDFMVDFPCFEKEHFKVIRVKQCRARSVIDYVLFTEEHSRGELSEKDNTCIITAYHLGCVGSTVYEECGAESFNRFKTSVKEIGFFKNGLCSSDLKKTLKATFLKRFDMTESRKSIYSSIIELKRRRK